VPFRTVELSQFGLTGLTPQDLSAFKNKLAADDNLTYRYLVSKLGFNPSDSQQYEQAMSLYIDEMNLITASKRKTYKFICQMHLSFDKVELDQCIADGKAAAAYEEAPLFLNQ
jgi:tagatose-1,6-bisphosphate aldolase non-catalytic subunit AgaZ/GatZ